MLAVGDEVIALPECEELDDPHTQRLRTGIKADVDAVSDEEIRRARRAYYANVSYFDSKVGEIVKALKESDQYDNTIIIVTSDHGDMLGERGLWYKMNFFEHAARVPLIISGPGVTTGVCNEPVSLIDLYPTMTEAAGSQQTLHSVFDGSTDGQSLWPVLAASNNASNFEGVAIAEYCAECTSHPMFMIRRGEYKYIHCDIDPPQLYNVVNDPLEKTNLSGTSEFKELENRFKQEVLERWDSETVRQDVLATQKQRHAVHLAMQQGALTSWDYQPPRDASQEFVRNHIEWTVMASKARYPKFKA